MVDQLLQALDAAELTDVGLVREKNEDTSKILIPPPDLAQAAMGALLMVVDGMGGMGGGDVASHYAAAEIARHYYTEGDLSAPPVQRLQDALQSASDVVSEQAPRIGRPRIGATAAGVLISPNGELVVFNVGDCRVYRVRQSQIERVSHDQSVMERQIDAGMSPERAAQVTRSSLVTAFLGQPLPLKPNIVQDQVQHDDVYLICSDGLWSLVEAREMLPILQRSSPGTATRKLIRLALQRGGQDNVTAVVVRVGKRSAVAGLVRRLIVALLAVLILVAGGVGLITYLNRNVKASSPTQDMATATNSLTATKASASATDSSTDSATRNAVVALSPTSASTATNQPSGTVLAGATVTVSATTKAMLPATATSTAPPTRTAAPSPLPPTPTSTATAEPTVDPASLKPTVTLNPNVLTYTPTPRRARTSVPSPTA